MLAPQIQALEDEIKVLREKSETFNVKLSKKIQKIKQLNFELEISRLKNVFLQSYIKEKLNVDPESIFSCTEHGVVCTDQGDGIIPVIVKNIVGEEKFSVQTKTKTPYRCMPKKELAPENPIEQEEKIRQVDVKILEIAKENNFDVSYNEKMEEIEKYFLELDTSRVFRPSVCTAIRDVREQLLGKLALEEYIKLIKTHVARLNRLFDKKKTETKKRAVFLLKFLTPLDQRFIKSEKYYDTAVSPEDIQRFNFALEVNMAHPKRYVPFDYSEFYSKVQNYGVVLCTIKKIFERSLINPYGYSNIAFLDQGKNELYSFYILESVKPNGYRQWNLDCRLETFCPTISRVLTTFCVNTFRSIYYDIFNDNIFREDYRQTNPGTSQDCEQLLQNIYFLNRQKSFRTWMIEFISKNCVLAPTELDKFNFKADDRESKKSYQSEKDCEKELIDLAKRLFDDISDQDASLVFIGETCLVDYD